MKKKRKIKENIENLYYRLKMNFNNGNVMKVLFICSAVIILYNCLDITAHASGILDYGNGKSPFEGVNSGWGQFMSDKFRNNYHLDAGDTSFFDISKILNAIANLVFWIVVTIAWLTLNIFNLCFNNNIPNQFASILDKVGSAFSNGVFNKFFMIMFMISTIMLVINYAKRNYSAIFGQLLATIIIIASVAIISSTGARSFVVDTTKFSKDIGASLITSINGVGNNKNGFSEDGNVTSEMLGTMWANLVQKPWVILEFNGTQALEDNNGNDNKDAVKLSSDILSRNQDDDEREELAKKHIKDVSFAARAGTAIVLGFVTIIKCLIIMVLGVLQVFFQILAIGIVLIAPLMFLLAVVPFFGGINLIKWLGQKYLGVQFGIVLLSFAIAMLVLVDNILLTFFMSVGASFVVAMLIQCLCWVLVIVFRRSIMDSLRTLQDKVSQGSGSHLRLGDKLLDKGAYAGRGAVEPIKRKAVDFKDLAGANARYAKTYMQGKAKVYKAKKMANIIDKVNDKFSKGTTEGAGEDLNKKTKYKGEKLDFDKLKDKKNEIEEKENQPITNIKDKLNGERNKEQDSIKFDNENDRNKVDDSKNNETENKEKLNNEREKEEDKTGVNLSEEGSKKNINKNENSQKVNSKIDKKANEETEKVVSLNDKRVEKGFDPVDDEKIKSDIRDNLNGAKIEDKQETKNNNKKSSKKVKTEAEKMIDKKRNESKQRAEKLKKILGVNKSQIRAKGIEVRKDLGSIKREKINIKNRKK